jgi:hypothetical protein
LEIAIGARRRGRLSLVPQRIAFRQLLDFLAESGLRAQQGTARMTFSDTGWEVEEDRA